MNKKMKICLTGLGMTFFCVGCDNSDEDGLWEWYYTDEDGNLNKVESISGGGPHHSKADDFEDFIDDKGEYISVFLLVVVAAIVGTILILLAGKKNNNNTNCNNSNNTVDNNERLLSNGGWKCSKCGRVNASYVTTCVCGMAKMNNNKTEKEKEKADISTADELAKYKKLLDDGVITQEEFDAKKKQLLGL